jgi:Flp pilus assembly protein TadD
LYLEKLAVAQLQASFAQDRKILFSEWHDCAATSGSCVSKTRHGASILLPIAGILLAAHLGLAYSPASVCKGPPELESKLQAQPNVVSYTELGTWFGEHQQFDCANDAFRSALKLDPDSAKLNYFLGLSLYSSGQPKDAVATLRKSIGLDAKALLPKLLLASILHETGEKSEAEAQWKAALAIDPASKEALDGLSNSMIESGDFQAAIGLLRDVKRDEDLNIDLALAYGQAGMLEDSATTLREALAANPASLRLINALVTVYVHQHRYQDAAALLQTYMQQHPESFEAQIQYLRVLVLNSDTTTARPLGAKLLAASPHDFDVLYLNGILEREAGDFAAARSHLQEAVNLRPDDYSSRYNLGTALAHLDDAAGAKVQLEKAVSLDGSQAEARFQLASVLRTLGESQAAQEQLAVYKQLSSASVARSQSDTKAELAAQKLTEGDAKQAASLYKEAADATPDNALLQYKLSVALDQAGDPVGERAALERAVEIDPTMAVAQNQLGFLASRNGEPAAAEKRFRLAVQAAPEFTEAWINLAATLAEESRFAEAQEAVATALRLDPKNEQAQQLSRQLTAAAHR